MTWAGVGREGFIDMGSSWVHAGGHRVDLGFAKGNGGNLAGCASILLQCSKYLISYIIYKWLKNILDL